MSVAERYISATHSKNLRLDERVSDADVLLAAAYASSGDRRKAMALDVWRMKHNGKITGFEHIVDHYVNRLVRSKRGIRISRARAEEVTKRTILWWMNNVCPECGGHGHPVIPGTPHLDESVDCVACEGYGVTPLKKHVRTDAFWAAQWISHELEILSAIVFDDMARLLRKEMDL